MSYNVTMKIREFLRKLKQIGVKDIPGRGKGGHVRLEFQGRQSVLPVHGSKDLDPVFIKTICKQLGINPKEIL
jgi:mRNA interferase HicA